MKEKLMKLADRWHEQADTARDEGDTQRADALVGCACDLRARLLMYEENDG